ncbi:TetR/AcrR family transcriptional regulator [Mycolicibacterium cosmeticum]|uniref:TetR family regulatory protein n=1 Tax=Mycolicibacterium cosmeticum TaxID=258533 RepID=W9B233_MYCCO|nr:TetR/AcrR family transcriptional regulator [Mycolicibacterium cosmeticum]TLH73259.1 TetR/AcrR family transcriptional regulator [Mycolicibacterium cosmeticum]CDO08886.1 TetR family regulatory protein [Mycolicibacterium cosmeticum]
MTDETVQRKRTNTRNRLLDASAELFARHGTTQVSIDDICRTSGFTRGAFYSNFKTVEDVFFALYERASADLLARMADASPQTTTATLEEAADALVDLIPADVDWYVIRASFAVRARGREDIAAALRSHSDQLRQGIEPFIDATVRAAGRRLTVALDVAAQVVIAANVGAVLQLAIIDDPTQALRRNAFLAALKGISEQAPTRSTRTQE